MNRAAGQTAESPGTVRYGVIYARNQLLVKYRGNKETLGQYGFNVVVGMAKSPVRKSKTT